MKKQLFSAVGILVILAALALFALGARFLYFTRQTSDMPYSDSRTAYSVVRAANSDFAQGEAYLDQKNYTGARQSYEKALTTAADQTQKNLINFNIGLTYERSGEYAKAIQIYKQIAATQGGYGRQEAVQAIGEMYYTHPKAKDAIAAETFKDAPYSSFKTGSDIELAYRKLFEYAVSIYPIGLSEARIAYWYANDVANTLKATTTTQALSEIDIVKQSITKADANIQRNIQVKSVEQSFHPSIYALEGMALQKLASVGVGSEQDADARWQKALALLSTPGAKRSLVLLAQSDPAFKAYLIMAGWHEADFK